MILDFHYLDQVINEVMRFYPALPRLINFIYMRYI